MDRTRQTRSKTLLNQPVRHASQTRERLEIFTRGQIPADSVSSPLAKNANRILERHKKRLAAQEASMNYREQRAGMHTLAHDVLVKEFRKIKAQQILGDNSLPMILIADAHTCLAEAVRKFPKDRGIKLAKAYVYNKWINSEDKSGSLTVGDVHTIRKHFLDTHPKSKIAQVIDKEFTKVGFNTLNIKELWRIASQVVNQDTYEAVIEANGLVGNTPGKIRARAFIRGLAELKMAEEEASVDNRSAADRSIDRLQAEGEWNKEAQFTQMGLIGYRDGLEGKPVNPIHQNDDEYQSGYQAGKKQQEEAGSSQDREADNGYGGPAMYPTAPAEDIVPPSDIVETEEEFPHEETTEEISMVENPYGGELVVELGVPEGEGMSEIEEEPEGEMTEMMEEETEEEYGPFMSLGQLEDLTEPSFIEEETESPLTEEEEGEMIEMMEEGEGEMPGSTSVVMTEPLHGKDVEITLTPLEEEEMEVEGVSKRTRQERLLRKIRKMLRQKSGSFVVEAKDPPKNIPTAHKDTWREAYKSWKEQQQRGKTPSEGEKFQHVTGIYKSMMEAKNVPESEWFTHEKKSYKVWVVNNGQRADDYLHSFKASSLPAALTRVAVLASEAGVNGEVYANKKEAIIILDKENKDYLHLVAEGPETGKEFYPKVNQQQPDQVDVSEDDGQEVLVGNNKLKQKRPKLKVPHLSKDAAAKVLAAQNITAASIENDIFDGKIVSNNGWNIRLTDDLDVVLWKSGAKSARATSLANIDRAISDWMCYAAAGKDAIEKCSKCGEEKCACEIGKKKFEATRAAKRLLYTAGYIPVFTIECPGCRSANTYNFPKEAADLGCDCGNIIKVDQIVDYFNSLDKSGGYREFMLHANVPLGTDSDLEINAKRMLREVLRIAPEAEIREANPNGLEMHVRGAMDDSVIKNVEKILREKFGIKEFGIREAYGVGTPPPRALRSPQTLADWVIRSMTPVTGTDPEQMARERFNILEEANRFETINDPVYQEAAKLIRQRVESLGSTPGLYTVMPEGMEQTAVDGDIAPAPPAEPIPAPPMPTTAAGEQHDPGLAWNPSSTVDQPGMAPEEGMEPLQPGVPGIKSTETGQGAQQQMMSGRSGRYIVSYLVNGNEKQIAIDTDSRFNARKLFRQHFKHDITRIAQDMDVSMPIPEGKPPPSIPEEFLQTEREVARGSQEEASILGALRHYRHEGLGPAEAIAQFLKDYEEESYEQAAIIRLTGVVYSKQPMMAGKIRAEIPKPKINTQQEDAEPNADTDLGPDSQTKSEITTPSKINEQVPAQKQPGTSEGTSGNLGPDSETKSEISTPDGKIKVQHPASDQQGTSDSVTPDNLGSDSQHGENRSTKMMDSVSDKANDALRSK